MLPSSEPTIRVGILTASRITVNFHGDFSDSEGNIVTGEILITRPGSEFTPVEPASAWFELRDVTIGVDFHWQRRETQRFAGSLLILPGLTAVNIIRLEDYLKSVISSEMRAAASPELLKAHAVISRSWLIAMLDRKNSAAVAEPDDRTDSPAERIQWWDREDHTLFDVCADDHCQRYQGMLRMSERAVQAVEETRGMVLTHDGTICDARFSKCCGGAFEEFQSCWAPVGKPYLIAARDLAEAAPLPNLSREPDAREWINGSPDAFCRTSDAEVLRQVLNDYDLETPDFYRWTVSYTAAEIAALIERRTGIAFGRIRSLEPVERGRSGRIVRLRITGSDRTMILGKELAIRRALSETHLYSSAFTVECGDSDPDGFPTSFTLHGAGWGHGVGLCQIGAAMMAHRGYSFRRILLHYYRGASLTTLYSRP